MNLAKKMKINLNKFMPSALRKRYGYASRATGFRPGTRVMVTDADGNEQPGTVFRDDRLDVVCVRLADGDVETVPASSVRPMSIRRRAASAEVARETSEE